MKDDYLLSTPQLFKTLKSTGKGLSSKEAAERLIRFGKNELRIKGGKSALSILVGQVWNIMILILSTAALASFIFEKAIDAIAILTVILLNIVIGFFQEYKAEKAVEALKKLAAPYALVMRDGQNVKIPANNVVPGDLLVLEEGMFIAADARVLEAQELKTLESSLTGESNAVHKTVEIPKKISSLGDLTHMVFMGTTVGKGHGLAVVIQTGMNTEFGQIAGMMEADQSEETPLQKEMNHMIKWLAILIGSIIALLFVLGWAQGRELKELFLTSISLGVSVIPEGLPTVITLTLAIGVQSMAKEKAIVRRLSAAESLGGVDIICTDKTGTLTQNEMTVERLYLNGETLRFEGDGYSPEQELPLANKDLDELLKACTLCNNATLFKNKNTWSITGDPTEGALLTFAKRGGFDRFELEEKHPRKGELVFDSDRKRMSTFDKKMLWCKGAPDSLLSVCKKILVKGEVKPLTAQHKKAIQEANASMAKEAYRVLALAQKPLSSAKDATETDLIFLGLVGMMDPPRKEVAEAIQVCKDARIGVVMITGDHLLTATAIGKSLGLYKDGDAAMTGEELERMSQKELLKVVEKITVFARVSPHHKVKILEALKAKGHRVAMTGDGINDAPALKRADVGIAMGITGTDVSKEASDIILTDDNFASIVKAVEKGRTIYQNIKKSIRFLLSTNFGEILLVSVLFILGAPSPFLPLQILWINLLTDTFPAIALGMDKPSKDLMKEAPRREQSSIWKEVTGTSFISAVFFVICALAYYETHKELELHHMRTFMFTLTVLFQLFLAFSVRHTQHGFFHGFFSNGWLLISLITSLGLQFLALYHPFFQGLLETEPLAKADWIWMLGLCILGTLCIEIWKWWRRRLPLSHAS